MNKTNPGLLLAFAAITGLCGATASSAPNGGTLDYHGDQYSYTIHLASSLDTARLCSLFYDYRNMGEYTKNAAVCLIDTLQDSYTVSQRHRYLYYDSKYVFSRRRVLDSCRIDIQLLSFWQNLTWVPHVTGIHAYFEFRSGADSATLTYSQTVTLDRQLGWFYMKIIRIKLDSFARDLTRFIRRAEQFRAAGR